MGDRETFQQLKLTSQKASSKTILVAIIVGATSITFLAIIFYGPPCNIQQITIVEDIKKYEINDDPELCAALVDRIIQYNYKCDGSIEILDCG